MLKEIHLVGNFYAAFADVSAVELGKAAVERSGVKPEDVKELLVGNILERRSKAQTPSARSGSGGASSAAKWESQWPLN